MNELIDKLEAAEGGSRELDCQILTATTGQKTTKSNHPDHPLAEGPKDSFGSTTGAWMHEVPRYCSSIDAALTLKPAWANCHGYDMEPDGCTAYFSLNRVPTGHLLIEGKAATPALALCIAALKAGAA